MDPVLIVLHTDLLEAQLPNDFPQRREELDNEHGICTKPSSLKSLKPSRNLTDGLKLR